MAHVGAGNQLLLLQHTLHHLDCPACEQSLRKAVNLRDLAKLEFSQAAALWFETHSLYISEETRLDYRKCIRALTAFFAGMILATVHIGNIREYQEERKHIQRVNKECCVLKMILHEANLWDAISTHYKPLPMKKSQKGRRLSWDEEDRLKRVVQKAVIENRKQWALAGSCLLIMANTSFGFKELKHLRRQDVYMDDRLIRLELSAKNQGRFRTVPLNQTAYDAMSYLIERWDRIGGTDGEELILPHRAHVAGAKWDFTIPMGSIKNAHKKIMAAARIENFRIYDARHHAISKWLGNPKIPIQVTEEMAGHLSSAMRKRYSHQLIETMRAAVDAMEAPKFRAESERLRVLHRKEEHFS